jgi:hypothetical protein
MKTTVNYLKRFTAVLFTLMIVSVAVFAEGGTSEVYLSGTTGTAAGDFVVTGTDDVYHYQGHEYKVYNVYYDNPRHNMKIAVLDEGNCKSYIAYTKDYWFRYDCTRHGFGVRKAMFTSAPVRDSFDAQAFHDQTILVKERRIEKDQAVGLIAAYLPKLQG